MSGKAERIAQTFNGKAQWIVAGGYFKLLETVNPVTVELFRDGQRVMYAAAAEGGFYTRADFNRVEITTGGAEAVAWFYGPQEGGQDRFSGIVSVTGLVGVSGILGQLAQVLVNAVNYLRVQVQGRGDAETNAGNAFFHQQVEGPVAANYAHVQLFNAAASGKAVYVDRILVSNQNTSVQTCRIAIYNTALGTDHGQGINRDVGGAASSAKVRTATNVATLGTNVLAMDIPANTTFVVDLDPPIKLGEGEGVLAGIATVNTALRASFLYREY